MTPADVQATFAATLVDEWARSGVAHAVVCPGSRNTPLLTALGGDGRLSVQVHHDERAAAFLALGIGRATGMPAVVAVTSGTAAVELHPAVVEGHHDAVPLICCTADRPPRLRGVGAPQTIDQAGLYGGSVRWAHDPGVAVETARDGWRSIAARALAAATGVPPGPVHLNLPFDEPLLGSPGDLPPAAGPSDLPERVALPDLGPQLSAVEGARGVIVAGGAALSDTGADAVHRLAAILGWPVLADARSAARRPGPATVAAFDALLRVPGFADAHRPDVVVQLGSLPASRVLSEWLAASGAFRLVVDPAGRPLDPSRSPGAVVAADPGAWCAALADGLAGEVDRGWQDRWAAAEAAAQDAIDTVLDGHAETTEPALARDLVRLLPSGGHLVVSSSMPVRDLEWYSEPRSGITVHANRGANGIDGVVSTAVGVAVGSGAPTTAFVGDIAFLYDANALLGAGGRTIDLTVLVADNDGGGIFHFLPQRSRLPGPAFERLFATPHGVDIGALARVFGADVTVIAERADLGDAVDGNGVRVLVARTDRTANERIHHDLHAAVAEAVSGLRQ